MGVGPNYILDKGFVAQGSTAYAFGELVVISARATSAGSLVLGVCQEALDATRLTRAGGTKAVIDIRLLGISRVIVGAAVAVGARLTNDASARAVTRTKAIAGAQPLETFGIALTAASAAGQQVDVLLTPGATL
jgi:hypothetical protein